MKSTINHLTGRFARQVLVTCFLLATMTSQRALCAAGDLDPSFDPGSSFNRPVFGLAVQTDGKLLVAGDFTTVRGAMRAGIARINTDGMPDPTFQCNLTPWSSDHRASAVAVQADGRIVVGGYFRGVNGIARTNLARLNPDGSLDNTFLAGMSGPDWYVGQFIVQSNGKILVAGGFSMINGTARNGIARLETNGAVDPSFVVRLTRGPGLGSLRKLAMQADERILVAGSFTNVNGINRTNLARLNPDGSVDASLALTLDAAGEIYDLIPQPDGKIVIIGEFSTVNGVARNRIARLNSDGSLDPSFMNGMSGPNNTLSLLAVCSDGRVFVTGNFKMFNGINCTNLARLNADGSLDTTFANSMPALYPNAMTLAADGRLVCHGYFVGHIRHSLLARFNDDGSPDWNFVGRTGPNNWVSDTAFQADGKVLIAGAFNQVNARPHSGIARLNADGSLDDSFNPRVGAFYDVPGYCIGLQEDGRILFGGSFNSVDGLTRNRLVRLMPDGSVDASFAPSFQDSIYGDSVMTMVHSIAIQPDGRMVVAGPFNQVNGLAYTNLVRLNTNGTVDESFRATVDGSWEPSLLVQPDGKILVAGGFQNVNGVARRFLARLSPDGQLDNTFLNGMSGPDSVVYSLALQPDGRILIGGEFATVNGVARKYLARLNSNGTLDGSFLNGLAGPNAATKSIAVLRSGRLLVSGYFSSVNGTPHPKLARLEPNGALDTSFLAGQSGPDEAVIAITPQPDGRILIGGWFDSVNGQAMSFVARLMGDAAPPGFALQPESQTCEFGSIAQLRCLANGYPPPTYQWYWNGTNLIADATNGVLQLANLPLGLSTALTVVASNAFGSVTSAPVAVNVIPPVERRTVPELHILSEPIGTLNLEYCETLKAPLQWTALDSLPASTSADWFDLANPLAAQRFYRVKQSGAPNTQPTLQLNMIPALTLTGSIGDRIRVDGINAVGPTGDWFTLATVTMTNTSQLFFDVTAPGQPRRLYRLVTVP